MSWEEMKRILRDRCENNYGEKERSKQIKADGNGKV